MENKIKTAFDAIHADEELKEKTLSFLKKKRRRSPGFRFAVATCSLLLIIGIVAAFNLYFTSVTTLSLDINPSIELGINRFDKVVSATAFNKDGKDILKSVKVKNLSYTEAVKTIMSCDVTKSYLAENAIVTYTVTSKINAQGKTINAVKDSCSLEAETEYFVEEEAKSDEAHELGLSVGKYRAYEELHRFNSQITTDDVKDMSMYDIKKLRDEYAEKGKNRGNRGNQSGNKSNEGQNSTDVTGEASQESKDGSEGSTGRISSETAPTTTYDDQSRVPSTTDSTISSSVNTPLPTGSMRHGEKNTSNSGNSATRPSSAMPRRTLNVEPTPSEPFETGKWGNGGGRWNQNENLPTQSGVWAREQSSTENDEVGNHGWWRGDPESGALKEGASPRGNRR